MFRPFGNATIANNSILINYYNNVLNNVAVTACARSDMMPCKLYAAFSLERRLALN